MTYLSELVSGKRRLQPATPVFEKTFDVIVCGLGTAGSNAALFSAENGLSVLGVETLTCAGGNHTLGGVVGYYFGSPGGRYEEMDKTVFDFAKRYTSTTAESRKFLMEQALVEKGVGLLYEATVCGVYLEENTVIGLRVLQNGHLTDYGAKVVMDCTAEAYVAAMAGCELECGRASDGQMQPYTLVSLVYDGRNYPDPHFWEIAGEVGCDVIFGADAHAPDMVWNPWSFGEAQAMVDKYRLHLIRTIGIKDHV